MPRRDDPAALERLCREYGDHLYDYCRSALDDDEALTAAVGALHGAVAHTDRLYDATRLRAWLYALARAECQARQGGVRHSGAYARQGRGGSPELAVEVLACLEPREREILDLTLRHGLKAEEVARVLDISVEAAESAAGLGRRHAEQWLAAVMDARSATPRCSVLPGLVKSWAESPTRLLRAHISRHVRSCAGCEGVPPKASISVLLSRLPILAGPAPSERLLAGADESFTAAETRTESWHPDGFPVQPDALEDPPPPQDPLTVEEGFAPERAEGRNPKVPEEFWELDPDADDPENRIRWGRVALVTVVSVASAGAIWSLVFGPTGKHPVDVEAAGGTIVVVPGDSLPPMLDSPPPPPPGGTAAPATTPGTAQPRASVPVPPPSSRTHPSATPSSKPKRTGPPSANNGPVTPPPPPKSSQPKASRSSQPQAKQSSSAPPTPPPPPPPSASVSTSSVDMGYSRRGSVTVRSQTGTIRWQAGNSTVSTSPVSGSLQEGETGTITFDLNVGRGTTSDCDRPLSTSMTISWSGDNKGTGGSGTIGVTISYTKPCPKAL
ncbi:sigma factor-like helix-turn-helix DNA-binding protein [Sphaerisporangium viridialbum]|uniref:sigma factor-like helix-turn-helix DNA-binding protein n=1 Tax=Sphaerisporangium viridialbum TaxID=46189 RepID=UPI003C79077C